MGVSKVEINRNGTTETLIDLTSDTVSEDKVLQGYSFHKANGESVVGTAVFQDWDMGYIAGTVTE